jgi:site-specific DNA-methyltransferase (adenine-specific)
MERESVETKNIEIDKIIPYTNNPRNNKKAIDKVASSIKEFGFKQPLVLDEENVVIVGHTRLEAAKKLGIKEVPCIIASDLTPAQIKAYRIADNKVGEMAEWDLEKLEIEFEALKEMDFDLELTGFNLEDIELGEEKEVIEDDFDSEKELENIEEPISKRGDIWLLGRHRLRCGDSTNADEVLDLMDGRKADLLITDPPYNVDYESKDKALSKFRGNKRVDNGGNVQIKNDKMDNEKFRSFLIDAFNSANTVMKEGAVFYIWHADSEGYNFRGACIDNGWKVRQCLIWVKNNIVIGRQDYQWKHEPCLYGWKEGAGHLWASDRKQTTLINYDKPVKSGMHPTMKPIGLFDYQIKNNTKGDDIVLDLFSGSGTTIMACEQNGRIGYAMELDEKYVDVGVKRYIEYKDSDEDVFLLREGKKIPYSELLE